MFFFVARTVFLLSALCILSSTSQTCSLTVEANFHQTNCTDRATDEKAYYLDKSSCVPKCGVYETTADNPDCTTNPDICIAGYSCEQRCGTKAEFKQYTCETDADCTKLPQGSRAVCKKYCVAPQMDDETGSVPCMAYHSNLPVYVSKWFKSQKFKPVCDDDGKWIAKQCKGGLQGRCMCFSAQGKRLFGQALHADADDMTCACSRRKSDLELSGRTMVSFHCDSKGNFEPFQCDMEKEVCWCADPKTGDLTSPMVPEKASTLLPCYSAVNKQYLRQCESKQFAQSMITLKLKTHGAKEVQADFLLCDADGSYGAYYIKSGIAYCSWRDNSLIEAWQASLAGLKDELTCNCARDYKMYQHGLTCEGSGNYVALQSYSSGSVTKYYCVDQDGFDKTDILDDATTDCSMYY